MKKLLLNLSLQFFPSNVDKKVDAGKKLSKKKEILWYLINIFVEINNLFINIEMGCVKSKPSKDQEIEQALDRIKEKEQAIDALIKQHE